MVYLQVKKEYPLDMINKMGLTKSSTDCFKFNLRIITAQVFPLEQKFEMFTHKKCYPFVIILCFYLNPNFFLFF